MINKRFTHTANRILLLSAALLFALSVSAIPAKPGQAKRITLSDGKVVSVRLVGDEHGHYWLGTDGKAYREDGNGLFRSIDRQAADQRAQTRRIQSNERRSIRMAARNRQMTIGDKQTAEGMQKAPTNKNSFVGKKKGIIILANYKDLAMEDAHDHELFDRFANEKDFSEGHFKGSVNDYFYAQSEGVFDLEFDVVGPVTLSQNRSYYGGNNAQGDDKHPASMVREACQLADSVANFADYDWDGDGEVDQVYVIYAGKGEADGGPASSVWPHEWSLAAARYYGDGGGSLTLDGVVIDTYACGSELNGSGLLDGIGTTCHEFSHCLGYPDFYDTDYSGGQGMGNWDLMDGGCYNGNGYVPAGYTSYERWVAGWIEPTPLAGKMTVTDMPHLQEKAEAYIIYNDNNKNEYFLLENRGNSGWDKELPGHGLLILHVDYNQRAWNENTPNDDPKHQRMTWIPADNDYQYTVYMGEKNYTKTGMRNDPFPYGEVNAFGTDTQPAAKFNTKTANGTYYMDFLVSDITRNSDGLISFYYKGSTVSAPTFSPTPGAYTAPLTVTIRCATKDAVIHYTSDGTTPTEESPIYTEPITIDTNTEFKAIAILDDEQSKVVSASYTIQPEGFSDSKSFKRVEKIDDVEKGKSYIIASVKGTAAGEMNSNYLTRVKITLDEDVITIGDDVEVFVLEGEGSSYSICNADGQYLYATATKKLDYSLERKTWTLKEVEDGVAMSFDNLGTILYNYSSPRFNIYTSTPSSVMLHALLFKEDNTPSAIQETPARPSANSQAIYTLSGVRVSGQTLPKGIYITNGKKFVVK